MQLTHRWVYVAQNLQVKENVVSVTKVKSASELGSMP